MLLNYTTTDDVLPWPMRWATRCTPSVAPGATFVYSNYTIFVAEVPRRSARVAARIHAEALHRPGRAHRAVATAIDKSPHVLHASHVADTSCGTRLAEQDQPTRPRFSRHYTTLLRDYYGDSIDMNPLTGITWARIPHFFNSRTTSIVRDMLRLTRACPARSCGETPTHARAISRS